jgi:methionine-rich copper-binding protein CopC
MDAQGVQPPLPPRRGADPKVGSTVPAPPSRVRVWFDSDLEPAFSSIAVHGPGGATVDDAHGRVDPSDPKLLEVDAPQLAPGTYLGQLERCRQGWTPHVR